MILEHLRIDRVVSPSIHLSFICLQKETDKIHTHAHRLVVRRTEVSRIPTASQEEKKATFSFMFVFEREYSVMYVSTYYHR